MKPEKLLEKYKKREKEKIYHGWKLEGANKLQRTLAKMNGSIKEINPNELKEILSYLNSIGIEYDMKQYKNGMVELYIPNPNEEEDK